jgi:hypothetical protein
VQSPCQVASFSIAGGPLYGLLPHRTSFQAYA